MTLVFFLDNRHFDSGKRVSWSGSFADASLRASDVTTLVSVALVLVRVAGQALILSMVWRCAMILLQHGGLSLGQLDKMLSYRIPTSLSGKYSLPIAVALLMMLPSAYVAPVLSGSVNWQGLVIHDTFPAGFGSRPGSEASDYWQRFRTDSNVRWEVTRKALAHASILWADIGPSSREARAQDHRFRYIAKQESVVGTIVEQAPMPYIKVESVAWDKVWAAGVEEILETNKSDKYFYTNSAIEGTWAVGTSLLFQPEPQPLPEQALPDGVLYATKEWGIAVLVGNNGTYFARTGKKDFNCKDFGWYGWGYVDSDITLQYKNTSLACWAVGTIKLTAGVRTARRGVYVTNRTVEAIEIEDDAGPRPDPWAEYTVFMLNDLNSQLSRVRSTSMVGGKVIFPELNEPGQQPLHTYIPSPLLQAKVAKLRVWLWLGLTMLLPSSWLVILWVESAAGGNLRAPVLSTGLSTGLMPLLTDVREVLLEDENGLSNMSYLTNEDRKGFGKIKLEILSTGPGGPPVYGLKAQRGGVLADLAGQNSG